MKLYLISPEILASQVFRYHPAYRFAAFLLCAFLVAQIPFIVWIVYERDLTSQRAERASQLASNQLSGDLSPLGRRHIICRTSSLLFSSSF